MKTSGLRLIYACFAIHLALLAGLTAIRNLEPVKDLRLTTQADGVIVYGENQFGLMAIRVFPTLKETQAYLAANNFTLPAAHFVEPIKQVELMVKTDRPHRYYRISWQNKSHDPIALMMAGQSARAYLQAPDVEAAMLMYESIRHSSVVASRFGFSIPLAN